MSDIEYQYRIVRSPGDYMFHVERRSTEYVCKGRKYWLFGKERFEPVARVRKAYKDQHGRLYWASLPWEGDDLYNFTSVALAQEYVTTRIKRDQDEGYKGDWQP